MRGASKREYLRHPRVPVSPDTHSVAELLDEMSATGFQGRKLGEAFEVWKRMLAERRNVIFMALAGAMVPAGMGALVAHLLRRRYVDVLVCTGATLSHDLYEALGGRHFLGTHMVDDAKLQHHRIDRVYDVYADEDRFYEADRWVMRWVREALDDRHPYSSREIVALIGQALQRKEKARRSVLVAAYEAGVPVFVPALGDSSLGFSIMFGNRRSGKKVIVDMMKDVDEITRIAEASPESSVVIVGGGVPKNYVQQTAVIAGYQTRHDRMHRLALQITTDSPQWGGLSGCTLEESVSWGKYHPDAEMVTCYADATIALPFLVSGLNEIRAEKWRNVPRFAFNNGKVAVSFGKKRQAS
jgi:deoxyhypusine synthase